MEWVRAVMATTLGMATSEALPPIIMQQEVSSVWDQIRECPADSVLGHALGLELLQSDPAFPLPLTAAALSRSELQSNPFYAARKHTSNIDMHISVISVHSCYSALSGAYDILASHQVVLCADNGVCHGSVAAGGL